MFSQSRSNESPMDWEWQTQGPVDPKTPFPQHTAQKRGFESNSFITASSKSAAPFRNPSFTTPRKPFDQDFFSEVSGAESSPADNADGEGTPETRNTTTMAAFTSGNSEKQPLFGRYGAGFTGNSPGRIEQRRGKYGNAIMKRVRKRKRIDRDLAMNIGHDTDSDSDSGDMRAKGRKIESEGRSWIGSIMSGIESRPNLPNILSFYVQLLMNFFLVGLLIYMCYAFWSVLRGDVDKALQKAINQAVNDMAVCANSFVTNGCGKSHRAPALSAVCDEWDACMNADPKMVGKAQVGARTIAEIFNSFVEPISTKSMVFIVIIVVVAFSVNNMAFGNFRAKDHHNIHVPHMPPSVTQLWPHQPQPSNYQWGPNHLPQTPHHNGGYSLYDEIPNQQIEGQRSPSKGDGRRSPSKGDRSPNKKDRSPSKGDQRMIGY